MLEQHHKLIEVASHSSCWCLKVNENKCKVQIPQADEITYLGIRLDRRLTWSRHISAKKLQPKLKSASLHWLLNMKSGLSLSNKVLYHPNPLACTTSQTRLRRRDKVAFYRATPSQQYIPTNGFCVLIWYMFLRGVLLHYFNLKKSATESHRILLDVYGDHALAERTCQNWFARFKSGNFDLDDGQAKKFQDEELETLLDADACQTQEELAKVLGVDQATVSRRLKSLGFI